MYVLRGILLASRARKAGHLTTTVNSHIKKIHVFFSK